MNIFFCSMQSLKHRWCDTHQSGYQLSATSHLWFRPLTAYYIREVGQWTSALTPKPRLTDHFCVWPRSTTMLLHQQLIKACIQTCALAGWPQACGGTLREKEVINPNSKLQTVNSMIIATASLHTHSYVALHLFAFCMCSSHRTVSS